MPQFNKTESFNVTGEPARSQSTVVGGTTLVSEDINFTSSGQVLIPTSGAAYNFATLAGVGFYFPGVGTDVTVRVNSSGGASGLLQSSIRLLSGAQEYSWLCSGPAALALSQTSGLVSAITYTNNFLASGQTSSGAARLLFLV